MATIDGVASSGLKPLANPRIFFSGTGGQGTLTATRLLGQAALEAGINALAGEIHGMAQRGGVVESCLLLGVWQAPRIDRGEADILLGFEILETLRALPYLRQGGFVFSSSQEIPPLSVCLGQEEYPSRAQIESDAAAVADYSIFIACDELGREAGHVKSGNTALLGALCASGLLPFGPEFLEIAINRYLPPKIRAVNLEAMRLGIKVFAQTRQGS